jgi:hypothetical protein
MSGTWELFAFTHPTRKKGSTLHSMTLLFIGCMKNSVSKIGCNYFWPGLIDLGNKTLPKLASWKLIKV